MPASYRIGIIGLGKMGWRHLEALRESPRWEIAWACDRDPDRLAAACDALPACSPATMPSP
ncbi:MAG: Gfo/Idh/MocA family oxidoreductase [Chloroflexia bacterium]